MTKEITLPVTTISEANRSRHEHWATTAKRHKAQRRIAYAYVAIEGPWNIDGGVVITLTRCSPRLLDGDNLQAALKHIRDGVCDGLHVKNDSDPRIKWSYGQEQVKGLQFVRVNIETVEAGLAKERTCQ